MDADGHKLSSTKTGAQVISLETLARDVEGELQGDPAYPVSRVCPVASLTEGALAFLVKSKRVKDLPDAGAGGALLLTPELYAAGKPGQHCILVADPYAAYARLSRRFATPFATTRGVHASAVVAPDVVLGPGCTVGPNAVLESGVELGEDSLVSAGCFLGQGVRLGARTQLRPNVTLYPDTQVGRDCLIHAGTVIGSDGFGFAPTAEGWEKIAHLGRVRIGDRVEIGANCTLDCGVQDDTLIESDVIIDNLVHLAHNTRVGSGSALAGQVGLAGSAQLGRRVLVGGQAGVAGHLQVADQVQLHGQSMVTNDLNESGVYGSGIPVQPVREWRRMVARLRQLDDLTRQVRALEKELGTLAGIRETDREE